LVYSEKQIEIFALCGVDDTELDFYISKSCTMMQCRQVGERNRVTNRRLDGFVRQMGSGLPYLCFQKTPNLQ